MISSRTLTFFALLIAAGVVASVAFPTSTLAEGPDVDNAKAPSSAGEGHRPVCPGQASPGSARCHAKVQTDSGGKPLVTVGPSGYSPADLQSAYQTPSGAAGTGITVAIVDAYDAPNAESDLAVYRAQFGLPPCTTANGCFRKVNESGVAGSYPVANVGWAEEISLDLDMVSAICPRCNILLVEASSNSMSRLGTAVNTAVRLGAKVVSNSYGGSEFSSESSVEASYFNHPGVAITVSSGDSGYGVQFPAASRYVTAVGGSRLTRAANARGWSETTWSGAGSGCSTYVLKPVWQTDTSCSRRTVSDVSAVADPNTGVAVYDTYGTSGWMVFGGTSVAAPIIGAIYALTGNTSTTDNYASYPYANASALYDVTSGSNGSCGGTYLCTATVGYDGPTGLGTPNGVAGLAKAAAMKDFSLTASPSARGVVAGASATYTVTLAATNGYSAPVNMTLTGLPPGTTATFSPNPATPVASPGATSSLSIVATAATPPGTYALSVKGTGTDAAITIHTAAISLTIGVSDFSVTAAPSSQTVTAGVGSVAYTVMLTSMNGYASPVALSATGLPDGATASFIPNPVTPLVGPGASSTLIITPNSSPPTGSYTLTVTGIGSDSAARTHAATVTLTIAGTASSELVNGTFETGGLSGWTSTGTTTVVGNAAHAGSYGARLGSTIPTIGDSSITQSFTVPANVGLLTFWYAVRCPETVTYGWATATLTDTTTGTSATILPRSCTNTGAWQRVSAAVIAAHSYKLTLISHDDNYPTDPTYTNFDDVALSVAVANPIVNGGFESGSLSNWTVAVTAGISGVGKHSGSFGAQVGGTSPTLGDSTITQTFAAPIGASQLGFWYAVHCPDIVTYDWVTATLRDITGGTTATILARTCTNTGVWKQASAAVIAGHTYTLTLVAHDDNYPGDPTYANFDDVVVQ